MTLKGHSMTFNVQFCLSKLFSPLWLEPFEIDTVIYGIHVQHEWFFAYNIWRQLKLPVHHDTLNKAEFAEFENH